MTRSLRRYSLMIGVAAAAWLCNGQISPTRISFVATAEAVVGAPATPVSYAGVARRSTVGAGAPGVGVTPGVGVGAPGVGVSPGVGAGGPGVNTPANQGGPVNRVGRH
jgi:hypothetical protein